MFDQKKKNLSKKKVQTNVVKTSIKHCTKILIYRMLENSKDILFKVRDRERENEGGKRKKRRR